jgi:ATP-binding cassette, subfamily B, bacterial
VLLGLLTVWVIFRFDRPYIRAQEEVNEREHVISATLFDSLSNILTVITLRLEQSMKAGLAAVVEAVFAPFQRMALINEYKWFAADMLVGLTYAVIAVGYVYQNWRPGQVFHIGTLVTLLGYVNQFTSVFHDVAWQYTQIVQQNTESLQRTGLRRPTNIATGRTRLRICRKDGRRSRSPGWTSPTANGRRWRMSRSRSAAGGVWP